MAVSSVTPLQCISAIYLYNMTTINKKYTIISNVDTFDHNNWYLYGKCKDLLESSMNTHVLIMYVMIFA